MSIDVGQAFGTYEISFVQKIIFKLVKIGWVRGNVRKIARRLWENCTASHGRKVYDVCRWGVRMRFRNDKNVMQDIILFNYKSFDGDEIDCFKKRISDGEVFADIGANIGYWGLRITQSFPNLKTLCFEPNPIMYERLVENIKLNHWESNITAIPYAISDKRESVKMTVWNPIDYSVSSINRQVLDNKVEDESTLEHFVDVETVPLKDCLEELGVKKIDALKIVVEGHEPYALLPYLKDTPKKDWPHTILLKNFFIDLWVESPLEYLLDNGYEILLKTKTGFVLGAPDKNEKNVV